MKYSATGEGYRVILYIAFADDEVSFKKSMIDECNIDEYFHVGITIGDHVDEDTDQVVFQHWKSIKRSCWGELKYEYYVNYS